MKKILVLATIIFLIILVVIVFVIIFAFQQAAQSEKVNIVTDKSEYGVGEVLKVKIENNSKKNVCFSSCYPYYLEKEKEKEWEEYPYPNCLTDNLVEKCISSGEIKAFKLTLPLRFTGSLRLAIPISVQGNMGEIFKEDKRFYSNQFMVK